MTIMFYSITGREGGTVGNEVATEEGQLAEKWLKEAATKEGDSWQGCREGGEGGRRGGRRGH